MSSGDKGHLGPLFDDFEFEPRAEVWDGIAAGSPQPGELTETFSDFNHAPHPKVWRRVVHQLYPARRSRAVVWWSSAAGIALLLGFLFLWPGTSGPAGSTDGLLAGNEVSPELRRINDAEQWSGRDLGLLPHNQDFTAALCAEGDAATRLALTSGFTFDWEGVDFLFNHPFELQFPYYQNNHGYVGPDINPWTPDWAAIQNNANEFYERAMNPVQPLESRTPDLLAMEEAQLNLMPSLVEVADIKRNRRPLDAKLGGQLAATNGIVLLGAESDMEFNQFNGTNPLTAQDLSGGQKDQETYQTPILLGFALQKYFSEKWSYLPGIVYTRLNSTFGENGQGSLSNYTRQRDYLGLQLGLQRDLVRGKKRLIYASANLTEEWGIRGKTKEFNPSINPSASINESSFRPLNESSFSMGIGTRFLLGDRISLYAEGSAVTYGPRSTNLFSRKLIWPRLQAGLNLNL